MTRSEQLERWFDEKASAGGYAFEVRTKWTQYPRPENKALVVNYGNFIRAPIPAKKYTRWGFLTKAGADRFKADFADSLLEKPDDGQ